MSIPPFRLSARFLLCNWVTPSHFSPKDVCSVSDLCFLTLLEVSEKIRAGEVSPVEVTKAELDRIAALDPKLKSYATLMSDAAIAQAKKAEAEIRRGDVKGPLHGVP